MEWSSVTAKFPYLVASATALEKQAKEDGTAFTNIKSNWDLDSLINSANFKLQKDFAEGLFIDYRYFDREDIEPVFEFGFGLSYTVFTYANLTATLQNLGPYRPANGMTEPTPTYGVVDIQPSSVLIPEGFDKILGMIYPWINKVSVSNITGTVENCLRAARMSLRILSYPQEEAYQVGTRSCIRWCMSSGWMYRTWVTSQGFIFLNFTSYLLDRQAQRLSCAALTK
ncbi:hypothetical protein F5X99DRAFT_196882 [Biscogniauxia marginata]|nr:hypothetical protein F5X99DRAFT_196882 [Biscogniauxia marginata]